MSLLTSAFSTPSQIWNIAAEEAQGGRSMPSADSIVESIEAQCGLPFPPLASPTSPHQEVPVPNKRSVSKEKDRMQRSTRRPSVPMRDPSPSLAWRYISPRQECPAVRQPSAMAHRAHSPSPAITGERQKNPTLNQNAVLFNQLESHGQTSYTSRSPELKPLDLRYYEDADILQFTDERPMAPNAQVVPITKPPPLQQDPQSTVRVIQAGK
jgi:hypothetical protein